ncbi:recombinase family protein [Bacillus sp. ISL-7]|uniref:recombinase family protein n=1 Tax=Bacillus sp. ISL-7 TaxID=2819136 RepID=UPI001BED10D4|nr:recombinase family protein [Bacillus sp. ISL-7]MBT2735185.1 recombinase family protein [Bacillus sp. ISL-7]
MHAALYIRVSTEEQSKEGYSLDAQKDKLEAFCFSQGWEVTKIFREEGQSAKDINRPQLKQLLKDLNSYDVVLVYKLDRLSRSVADINKLLQTFEDNEVSFKSATEPYDTTTAQGKLLINIFASLAQFEREQLAERVYMGMTKKAELGERNGGRAPFGYRLKDGSLVIDEKEAKIIQEMFRLYISGKGIRSIVLYMQQFGLKKDIRTISRWLENPVYAGKLRWGNRSKMDTIIYDDTSHAAIIDEETFEKVQLLRNKRTMEGKKATSPYHFSGVLRCARCGGPLSGWFRKAKGTKHYLCVNKKNKGTCDLPQFTETALAKTFLDELSADDPQQFLQLSKDFNIEHEQSDQTHLIKEFEKELSAIKNRKRNWLLALGNGIMSQDEYKSMTADDTKKEEMIKEQLAAITPQEVRYDRDAIINMLDNIPHLWDTANDFEKKSFINDLFESITVDVPSSYYRAPGKTPSVLISEVKFL